MRVFRIYVPGSVLTLLVVEIALIAFSMLAAAYLFFVPDPTIFLLYEGGTERILLMVVTVVMTMHFQDLYARARIRSKLLLAHNLCVAAGSAFLVQGLISYLRGGLRMPIRVMVPGTFFAIVLIFCWRIMFTTYVWKMGNKRVLFVGDSSLLDEAAEYLHANPDLGVELIGYLDNSFPENRHPYGKVIAPIARLREIAESVRPDLIVVAMRERRESMPMSDLLALRFAGFGIEDAASFFETVCGRVSLAHVRPSQLIFSGEFQVRRSWAGNLMNVTVALTGIIVSSPVLLLIAVAIKASSKGPVLYRQARVGLNDQVFTLYKFRSMYEDAEKRTGAVWSSADDPRITPLGGVLRKLRLDEIPQLFNVLCREMAIVGPRPERPEFVRVLDERIPYYRQRHVVLPGITGWAQVNYRYGETFEDAVRKLEYDLYYIKHRSLSLDNYIIFATLKTMFLMRGAR